MWDFSWFFHVFFVCEKEGIRDDEREKRELNGSATKEKIEDLYKTYKYITSKPNSLPQNASKKKLISVHSF